MKKCSFIRSNKSEKKCPFGLSITEGCKNAGNSTTHMCPLELIKEDEKRDKVIKANYRVYIYYKNGERCIYANNIIDKSNAVNCDFGDTGAGMNIPTISGSPLYAQSFGGVGVEGLYAFPLGYYVDNNASRNLFQGLFSLVGCNKSNKKNGE